jgi:uncharacterized protein DUF2334
MFAADAAEFLSLSPEEMVARVASGRQILEKSGLSTAGFCAPGWIEPPNLRAVLRVSGFRYDITLTQLVDLRDGHRIWTDWVGYMGAGSVLEGLVAIANGLNWLSAPMFSVLKCFLHPQHARESAACRRILRLIPYLIPERTLTTYGQRIGR